MRRALDPSVVDLFQLQHGLITRTQALDVGLSPGEIGTLVRSGRWERLGPSLYGVPGHRRSWLRDLWAAWLHGGPGAVVAHQAAARLPGFVEAEAGTLDLIVPGRRRHPPPGVRWHRCDDLDPSDIVELRGLPVTSPVRTAVDLAGSMHIARLRLLVETGIVERRFTVEGVGAALGRLRRQGKPGVLALSTVLDDLGSGEGIPRTELERMLDHVIAEARLPAPVHEHPLPGHGARSGFVDRCWPGAQLIVEADGRKWHTRRQRIAADHDRSLQAQAAGYETSRLMWEQLRHDPAATARLLATIHRNRSELLGVPRFA